MPAKVFSLRKEDTRRRRKARFTGRVATAVSMASAVTLAAVPFWRPAFAQQVLANGVTVTASGTINTGTTGGDPGIGLRAINGGVIQSFSPLTVITGGANAIGAQALGGSQINIFSGSSIKTSGVNADGLVSSGAGSIVTATDTTVTLLTSGFGAIAGSGGAIALSGVSIVAPNTGVTALGVGTVTMTNGSVTSSGVNSGAVVANGASATISATGTAILGTAAGTRGVLAVNGGQVALSDVSVTSTGGGTAVQAFSVGKVTLNNSTVTADSGNALHATVGPNVLITANGTDIVTTGTGANGALVQSGAAINITGGSTITTNGPTSHGALVSNASLAISDSTVTALGAGSDAIRATSGASSVSIERSTLNAAQGAGISALGGTLNATITSSSIVGGPLAFRAINNSVLNLTADGSILTGTALTASGSTTNVALQNGTTWNVTDDSNVTNLVNDPSLIRLTAPVGDPTLLSSYKTLTVVNYTGRGGVIGLNTYLDTDGSPSDRLIINGGTATGNSLLRIANAGGGGALTTGNGILVVDTINGGTTAPGTFALAGTVAAGPYEYHLFRSSVDSSNDQAWYLRSTINCALTPSDPVCQGPTPPPPGPVPDFRPETSFYAAIPSLALLYGRNLLDTLHERVGDEEDIRGRGDLHQVTPNTGMWGRIIGATGQQNTDPAGIFGGGPQYKYDFLGLQAGQDLWRAEHADGSRDHAGVYFAVGGARGHVTHFDGALGTDSFQAYTIGGYWTHFGPTGWYVDTVLQGTYYDVLGGVSQAPGGQQITTNGRAIAASLEGGYRFNLPQGYFIEPQAQLVYQNIDLSGAQDMAAQIRFSNVDSLAGRIGARFGRTFALDDAQAGGFARTVTAWLRPNFWHEFRGNPLTQFSSDTGFIPFNSSLGGSWGELNAGVSGQLNRFTTLFANGSYQQRFEGKTYAYEGKLGIRINW
ncbi:outer membrane autotransporter protein [Bradyrhizobium elkanii]|nr:outer membrane autotransporter protein [Bradyrhizobium elkanii]